MFNVGKGIPGHYCSYESQGFVTSTQLWFHGSLRLAGDVGLAESCNILLPGREMRPGLWVPHPGLLRTLLEAFLLLIAALPGEAGEKEVPE